MLGPALLVLSAQLAGRVSAAPFQQHQQPFAAPSPDVINDRLDDDFNVLHHLSGISPFFDSHGGTPEAPKGCAVVSAAIIARHSSITMNDDEFPETIEPFNKKLEDYDRQAPPDGSPFAFFKDGWTTPVTEDNMEELTGPGAEDAKSYGQRLRDLYGYLLPGDKDPAFKIFSASSQRDVDSSTAFISGIFPNRTIGTKSGQVDLIKVPNKSKHWATSLTPHKACDRFDKEVGKKERNAYQKGYAKAAIARLGKELPGWDWSWTDVVAMQQLCGYETVIRGSSDFCNVFNRQEFEQFEYSQDLYYFYMLGRQNKWTAALGVPWLQVAAAKLNETASRPVLHPLPAIPTPHAAMMEGFEPTSTTSTLKLPKPTTGPNATLSQPLHVWFTHREEIPVVIGALDLFHGHTKEESAMPLDRINPDRAWKTSEIMPFLGHVALERLECDERVLSGPGDKADKAGKPKPVTKPFVRIIVNGSPQELLTCNDGPGGSCSLGEFGDIVRALPATYGDLDTVCEKKEK